MCGSGADLKSRGIVLTGERRRGYKLCQILSFAAGSLEGIMKVLSPTAKGEHSRFHTADESL